MTPHCKYLVQVAAWIDGASTVLRGMSTEDCAEDCPCNPDSGRSRWDAMQADADPCPRCVAVKLLESIPKINPPSDSERCAALVDKWRTEVRERMDRDQRLRMQLPNTTTDEELLEKLNGLANSLRTPAETKPLPPPSLTS